MVYSAKKAIPETRMNRPEIWYLVESCCILFSVILRWFNSTVKSQETLKTNRAITIHQVPEKETWMGGF
jgi:hypothetical protein